MKKFFLLFTAVVTVLVSCKKDKAEELPVIVIDQEMVAKELSSAAQEFTIPVKSTISYTVDISYPGSSRNWLEQVTGTTRALTSSDLKFSVTKWDGASARQAVVKLTGANFTRSFKVVQNAPAGALGLEIVDKTLDITEVEGVYRINVDQWGITIPVAITTTAAGFNAYTDESTPWVNIASNPGVNPVQIKVNTAHTGDIYDYSSQRVAVVHFETADKTVSDHIVIIQDPRVAGYYKLKHDAVAEEIESTEEADLIANSLIGKLMNEEHIAFRTSMEDIIVETIPNEENKLVELTKYDLLAIKNLAPNIKTLDLEEAVCNEEIPIDLFNGYSNLKKVILPEGITKIGNSAFRDCILLSSINIPSTVTAIGQYAFYGCNAFTEITLPDGIITMDASCFSRCTLLKSINIPANLETLGGSAFYNSPLESPITIPRALSSMGTSSFYGNKLKGLYFAEPEQEEVIGGGRLAIPNQAFFSTSSGTGGATVSNDIVIPNWVNTIGYWAFVGIAMDESENAQSISLTIGKNVTNIAYGAFAYCPQINRIDFGEGGAISFPDNTTQDINRAPIGCAGITEIRYPMSPRVPQTAIPTNMFGGWSKLRKITIAAGVTEIKYGAFAGTAAYSLQLDEFIMEKPEDLKTIGNYAFYYVTKFPTIGGIEGVLDLSGTKVTSIGGYAFSAATGLKHIKFPETLTTLGANAFYHFNGSPGVEDYDFSNTKVTTIPANLFGGNTTVKTIKFPEITSIANANAFTGCTALTKLYFPKSMDPVTLANLPSGVPIEYYE